MLNHTKSSFFRQAFGIGILVTVGISFGLNRTGVCAASNGKKTIVAGAAVVDTSPVEFPVKINGSFIPSWSSVLSDRLSARAIFLSDGDVSMVFCVVDACVMDANLRDEIAEEVAEQTGVSPESILIAATHSHTCPSLALTLGCGPDENYVSFVKPKIVEAILQAYQRQEPARIGWGVATDRENVYCRRFMMRPGTAWSLPAAFTGSPRNIAMMNPGMNHPGIVSRTGVPDPAVSLLALESLDGRPLALLANYSVHYVGAAGVSSDYFGLFCEKIAEKIQADENFVAMMTNGTSGDTNSADYLNPARKFDKESVAESVAAAAKTAYDAMEFYEEIPLAVSETTKTLTIRQPSEADMLEAKKFIEAEQISEPRNAQDVYAFDTVSLFHDPGERTVRLQAFRVGDMALGAIPCEVYSFTGLDLKANSPAKNSMVISMANGYFGYIPTVWSFELGGYTTWRACSSCLEVEAEPKIRAEILSLWHRLFPID